MPFIQIAALRRGQAVRFITDESGGEMMVHTFERLFLDAGSLDVVFGRLVVDPLFELPESLAATEADDETVLLGGRSVRDSFSTGRNQFVYANRLPATVLDAGIEAMGNGWRHLQLGNVVDLSIVPVSATADR